MSPLGLTSAHQPHLPPLSQPFHTRRPCAPGASSLPQGLLKHCFEEGHVGKVLVLGHLPSRHHAHYFLVQGRLHLWAL